MHSSRSLQPSTSKEPFWPLSYRIKFTWSQKIFDAQVKITRHIAKVLYSVMLQGRGIVIISEVRGTEMSNVVIIIINIIICMYVLLTKKILSLTFNWLRNKIYCWAIITSCGYDCTISIYNTNYFIFYHRIRQKIYVTLDHNTNLKSLGYICSNNQKYILWVKMIDLSFMPKIIKILSKDHVPWRYFVPLIYHFFFSN